MNESDDVVPRDLEELTKTDPFPPEFMGTLQETAFVTLEEYLRKYQAPEVVIDLLRDLVFLYDVRELGPREGYAVAVQSAVSRLTWEIQLLGGTFQGRYLVSARSEPVEWPGWAEAHNE